MKQYCNYDTEKCCRTTKLKVSKRKEITKIRAEINELETRKTINYINDTKRNAWVAQ